MPNFSQKYISNIFGTHYKASNENRNILIGYQYLALKSKYSQLHKENRKKNIKNSRICFQKLLGNIALIIIYFVWIFETLRMF